MTNKSWRCKRKVHIFIYSAFMYSHGYTCAWHILCNFISASVGINKNYQKDWNFANMLLFYCKVLSLLIAWTQFSRRKKWHPSDNSEAFFFRANAWASNNDKGYRSFKTCHNAKFHLFVRLCGVIQMNLVLDFNRRATVSPNNSGERRPNEVRKVYTKNNNCCNYKKIS